MPEPGPARTLRPAEEEKSMEFLLIAGVLILIEVAALNFSTRGDA